MKQKNRVFSKSMIGDLVLCWCSEKTSSSWDVKVLKVAHVTHAAREMSWEENAPGRKELS